MALGLSASVMAATDINENEQKVITAISVTGFKIDGKTVVLAPEEVNEAKNFMMRDDIDLNAADADSLLKGIEDIGAVMEKAGVARFTDLSQSDKQEILDIAKSAVAGVKSKNLSFTYDSNTRMASILDKDTSAVLASTDVTRQSTVIKQTGMGLATTYIIIAGALIAVGAAVVVARKTNLLATKNS